MSRLEKKRSDSSRALRDQLKQDYIFVPDVRHSVAFEKYLRFAESILSEAYSSFTKRDLTNAYINYKKFSEFFDKLVLHPSFKAPKYSKTIGFLKQALGTSVQNLEKVVEAMDEAEDLSVINAHEIELAELFDDLLDESASAAPPAPSLSEADVAILLHANKKSSPVTVDLLISAPQVVVPMPCAPAVGRSSPTPPSSLSTTLPSALVPPASAIESSRNPIVPSQPVLSLLPGPPCSQPPATFPPRAHASGPLLALALGPPMSDSAPTASITDTPVGVSHSDIRILRCLSTFISRFFIPPPTCSSMILKVLTAHRMQKLDFHVSFLPLLQTLPIELQLSRPAIETNRCFFVHLGIAIQIHPFALECCFRHFASIHMLKSSSEEFSADILSTVKEYSGFVDANCLCFLWPVEFNGLHLCIISGSLNRPMFSCFSRKGASIQREVIIHCDGSHFTLLSQQQQRQQLVLPQLLHEAKAAGLVVQYNEIDQSAEQYSIFDTFQRFLR